MCRLHRLLAELTPGGMRRELSANKAQALLARIRPADDVGRVRVHIARDHLADIRASTAAPVVIEDASVAADYVSSLTDHYQPQVAQPWREVAEDVRKQVQAVIDTEGAFRTAGDVAAFVCR